jgi:hypothetical protein
MGGRVAEELSKFPFFNVKLTLIYQIRQVYGRDNVTSGASSDIRSATRIATSMVKVCAVVIRNERPCSNSPFS